MDQNWGFGLGFDLGLGLGLGFDAGFDLVGDPGVTGSGFFGFGSGSVGATTMTIPDWVDLGLEFDFDLAFDRETCGADMVISSVQSRASQYGVPPHR